MNPQIISFNCLLKNGVGTVISNTYSRDVLTAIDDQKAMLLGLAKGLTNLKQGEKRHLNHVVECFQSMP